MNKNEIPGRRVIEYVTKQNVDVGLISSAGSDILYEYFLMQRLCFTALEKKFSFMNMEANQFTMKVCKFLSMLGSNGQSTVRIF